MPGTVIRLRSEIEAYVEAEAHRRSISPADYVNGVLESHRWLRIEASRGLPETTLEAVRAHGPSWVAFLVTPPTQPMQLVGGCVNRWGPTSIQMATPIGNVTQVYELPLSWLSDYFPLLHPVSELEGLAERLQPWGITPHYLTEAYLRGYRAR